MTRYDAPDEDHQPLMWLRGHAIYAAYFIVLVYVASMLVTSVLLFANSAHLLTWAQFSSVEVLKGQIWRIFSYGFVNPPSLWFAVDMFMIAWFGRELEKIFGRQRFLRLFAGLYLLPPLLFTLIGLWRPMQFSGELGAFALFIAFATLYPNVVMFFSVPAKWIAAILVSINTLMALSNHDWVALISLWATTGFAYAFVSFEQGRFTLPSINFWQRKPKLRLLPDLKPTKTVSISVAKEDSMAEMDSLLDKIARSGMSSLTTKERAQLAKARESMMQKKGERS